MSGQSFAPNGSDKGFRAGDIIVGNEGYGDTIIELTAIGRKFVLAIKLAHDSNAASSCRESIWGLDIRDWRLATDEDLMAAGLDLRPRAKPRIAVATPGAMTRLTGEELDAFGFRRFARLDLGDVNRMPPEPPAPRLYSSPGVHARECRCASCEAGQTPKESKLSAWFRRLLVKGEA